LPRSAASASIALVAHAARRAVATGGLELRRWAFAGGVFVLLTSVAFADGGVLPRTWRLATLALLALAAAALVARKPIALTRLEWCVLGSYVAVAGWTAASAAWSGRPTASLLQAERVVVYAAAMLAFLLLVEREVLPYALGGTLAAICVVAAYGLIRYAIAPPPLDPYEGRLLFQPIGYANALGLVTAIGIVLALGGAAWAPRGPQRAAALGAIALLAPALVLTSSRGAWVALAAGLVVLVAYRVGPLAAGVIVGGVLVAAIVVAVVGSPHRSAVARLAGEDRAQYWRVAAHDYQQHPLFGSGAGTFGEYWLRHRPVPTFTRTAHSLYLESLAELGSLGLALVVAAFALPLATLRRAGRLETAAAAGYVVYLVHAGVDWDWQLPGATLPALVCAGALLVSGRDGRRGAARARAGTALLVSVLAVAVLELVRLATGPGTPFGGS
jgi:O-antigen ligase